MRFVLSVSQYKCQLTLIFKRGNKKHKPITEKKNKKMQARQLCCKLNKPDEQTKKRNTHESNLLQLQCCTVPTLWMHSIDVLQLHSRFYYEEKIIFCRSFPTCTPILFKQKFIDHIKSQTIWMCTLAWRNAGDTHLCTNL